MAAGTALVYPRPGCQFRRDGPCRPSDVDCLPIRALKLIKWLQCSQGHRQPLRQLYTRRPAGVRNVLKRVSCTPEGPVAYEMRAGHEKPRNRGLRATLGAENVAGTGLKCLPATLWAVFVDGTDLRWLRLSSKNASRR